MPICTPLAPKAKAAAMPPAAITGTETASATWGTRAKVPTVPLSIPFRKVPRWPPASLPWATITSASLASSTLALATVVAELMTMIPAAFSAAMAAAPGRPKWKLATRGRRASRASSIAAPKGGKICSGAGTASEFFIHSACIA